MDNLLRDLRFGLRTLVKSPGSTIVAVLTLALGIGANTAIFSVVSTVLLDPLPYKDPDRLVEIRETNVKKGWNWIHPSPANFLDWKDRNSVFKEMAAWRVWFYSLTNTKEPEQLPGARVSANFFDLLGTEAALGRTFLAEEEQAGKNQVVVITHGLWKRRFAADPHLVGQTINIDNQPFTVVGILPPDFRFPRFFLGGDYELWMPLAFDLDQLDRTDHSISVYARLSGNVSLEQAQAEMDGIARQLAEEYPATNGDVGVTIQTLQGYSEDVRLSLLLLFVAVGFVLLISCANVASLLVAKTIARQREIAIRKAVGAGQLLLIRQLLVEGLLLAGLGGGAGLLLAFWGIDLFKLVGPPNFPRLAEIIISGKVIGFTTLISALTAVICALAPALSGCKSNLNDLLKDSVRSSTTSLAGVRLQNLLVVSEVALAVVVLVGAGLTLKSFVHLRTQDRGFNPGNLLTMQMWLPESQYLSSQDTVTFYSELIERVASLKPVKSVSMASFLPTAGWGDNVAFTIEGRPALPGAELPVSAYRVVDSNFFRTMGLPLLKGRYLTPQDEERAAGVVLIDEIAAHRFWPDENPIGKRIRLTIPEADAPWRGELNNSWLSIVGVVGAIKEDGIVEVSWPYFYLPYSQNPSRLMTLVIRTNSDPLDLAPALRDQVSAVNRNQPVFSIRSMEGVLSHSLWKPRFYATLFGVFSALALVLAAVGVYSVIAYSISQRRHEFGIRMSVGAQQGDVLCLVFKQAFLLILPGLAIGLLGALGLTRVMSTLLYGIGTTDPTTFIGVSLLLSVTGSLACYIPARRATKVDPMTALRYE